MIDLRKAAEMALKRLDMYFVEHGNDDDFEATQALRQALAQPKQHLKFEGPIHVECQCDKCKALVQPEQESVICRNIYEVWAGSDGVPIPETIVEAYLLRLIEQMRDEASKGLKALYTAPPKREWVGLTDEELRQAYCEVSGKEWCLGGMSNAHTFYEVIEAKLKEKNGG